MRTARKAYFPFRSLILLCLLLPASCDTDGSGGVSDSPAVSGLLAGFAAVDITPAVPVKMAGYGIYFFAESNCRWSTGVHDPLYARAVAFQNGGPDSTSVVLIVLDLVGAMLDDVLAIQQGVAQATGIAADAVVVSSTHTHHGPDTIGLYGTVLPPISGRDDAVVGGMLAGAVEAGVRAWEARIHCRLSFAVGQEPRLHENRVTGDPNRKIDSTVTLLAAHDSRGRLAGTVMNWACHPTVMGAGNTLLSSDFAGAYYRIMAERLGGTHLFVNGALGASIEPVERFLAPDRWDKVDEAGATLADDAEALLARAEPVAQPSLDRLEHRAVGVELENPALYLAALLGLIDRELPPPGEKAATRITTFAIGPIRFGTLPGEYVPDYGLALREILGGSAQVVVGLGMDWIGYAVTPEQYGNLAYIYERLLCPGRTAGSEVIAAYRGE
jgi:hypothetical protein